MNNYSYVYYTIILFIVKWDLQKKWQHIFVYAAMSYTICVPALLITKTNQFSLSEDKLSIRAKKCPGAPVLKYSYQDSSVFD